MSENPLPETWLTTALTLPVLPVFWGAPLGTQRVPRPGSLAVSEVAQGPRPEDGPRHPERGVTPATARRRAMYISGRWNCCELWARVGGLAWACVDCGPRQPCPQNVGNVGNVAAKRAFTGKVPPSDWVSHPNDLEDMALFLLFKEQSSQHLDNLGRRQSETGRRKVNRQAPPPRTLSMTG